MKRVALALAASLLACADPQGSLGEDCLFNGDCASPLVCAGRRCRAPCRSDRDCANGWRCRPAGQEGLRVCLAPEEHGYCTVARDCDAPAVCGVTGRCGSQCEGSYDCMLHGGVANCAPTRQDPTVRLCTDHPYYQPMSGP